jgi:putative copper resistance protein D
MAQLLDLFGFLSVVLRALLLALQSLVVGGVVFSAFILRGSAGKAAAPVRESGAAGAQAAGKEPAGATAGDTAPAGAAGDAAAVRAAARACRRLLAGSAFALAATAIAYLAADSAILMATAGLRFSEVVGANFFLAGAAGAFLALASGALALTRGDHSNRRTAGRAATFSALLFAAGLVATSVATSHAAARLEGRALPVLLTALHQAAAGCWIGGLPYLLLTLPRTAGRAAARRIAARFSRLAQASVAVLLAAGIGLALLYVGAPPAILGTAYGAMVGAKILLFALLLALGAFNYSLVKSAGQAPGAGGEASLLTRLRRFAEAEVGIGFTAILTAASLTSQPPAADLASGSVPLAEIAARMSPRRPRLVPPALRDMVPPSAAAAADGAALESFVPGQLPEPQTAGEIALSEFNHNASGLVVLAAGLLALAARAGWRWARNWPLAFLGLAVFLFFLADADYWPLGPLGFWRGFTVSEVLQHRLVVVLIVAFALFERRVQSGGGASPRAALVFPFVCALGGALLLTHSHSLNNPKDELLAELSHVPIALLGVTAGWARWLELRLQGGPRRALAWIWPLCFVLVGAVLLAYRES